MSVWRYRLTPTTEQWDSKICVVECINGPAAGYGFKILGWKVGDILYVTNLKASYLGTGRMTPFGNHEAIYLDPDESLEGLNVNEREPIAV